MLARILHVAHLVIFDKGLWECVGCRSRFASSEVRERMTAYVAGETRSYAVVPIRRRSASEGFRL